ncbi:MAG: PilX N-terminal domain-containing pilus assembly protein [Cellvibrionaceae bacterium]|nr:PilX N-terminal domain-containing pilus assembly protein [Cellvibrionaceae bacterium]
MKMKTLSQRATLNIFKNQRGATLIVALVVLLIMSVVAVASMSSSSLQAKMASNERQIQMALHAAEAGSRAAVLFLNTASEEPYLRFRDPTQGLYNNTINNAQGLIESVSIDSSFPDYHDPSAWDDENSQSVVAASDGLPSASAPPRYIIEFLGEQKLGGDLEEMNDNVPKAKPVYHYKIIAIGWAQDPQVYSIVQTTYKTQDTF